MGVGGTEGAGGTGAGSADMAAAGTERDVASDAGEGRGAEGDGVSV